MAERTSFSKGRKNLPAYILLELQTGQEVQVYDVRVYFAARFEGLRWMMYNHRIMSFVVFVSAFWVAEVLWAAMGWMVMRSFFGSGSSSTPATIKSEETDGTTTATIKKEEDETDDPDLSDTPRTFPTYGRQPPLRYVPKIKDEDSEEYILDETAVQPLVAEAADDESEEFGGRSGRDSGIGTSFSEGGERGGVARRRSRGGRPRT